MEELELVVEFYEKKIYGEDKSKFIVKAIEECSLAPIADEWEFESAEDLKNNFPTFKSLILEFFNSEHWSYKASEGDDRQITILNVIGNNGLYDDLESVAYASECSDEEEDGEEEE